MKNNSVDRNAPLVVGVGASAGGLEAFQELLRGVGDLNNIAVIFVQHLEKGSDTLLVELLAKVTPCQVVLMTGRRKAKAGTIYVCPPWTSLEIRNGIIRAGAIQNEERPVAPIDHFLHSLAEDQGERGVGVILSGTGTDGTVGLKAISDAGGMTFAQLPESARFDSMPRSATTTGIADHVLVPGDIAEELTRYAAYLKSIEDNQQQPLGVDKIHEAIPAITKLVMDVTNHNFQHYKQNTLTRRIRRRMQVLKHSNVDTYVSLLKSDPEEPLALFRELLISVTAFFRDPEAFEVLAETVIPKLFANRSPTDAVRIWVPGCATGEEAFTLAILCLEHMEQLNSRPEVQIFATDIDERALKISRQGIYPIGIEHDVSAVRLKRFFIKRGKKYQVTKEVRELVLFSAHNLISDPPFSRQDLISCRNLLIYLGSHLQKKLIPLFHYALRPSGFLMLGPSENISSHGELFRTLDAKYRISQRRDTGVDASAALSQEAGGAIAGKSLQPVATNAAPGDDLMQIMQRIVLDEFAPKSVIVGEDGKILCASADMHKYLTVATGNFQNNIIKMARPGLRVGLRTALHEARTTRRRIVHDDLSVRIEGKLQRVMLTVQPMPRIGEDAELLMVVFHDCGLPLMRGEKASDAADRGLAESAHNASHGGDAIIAHLERELSSTRDDLEKSIQEYEIANEELKSSNEELLSLNEEMQSANEELATSKEEIQTGITALRKAHSDLENLFQSTQIATLFLDLNEHLIQFTPAACEVYNLISTDIGRSLGDITHKAIEMPPIPAMADLILADNFVEEEIQTRSGRWFLRRALPCFHEGQAEGVILTFIDVTERKRALIRLATMHLVARILASDPSVDSIFPEILRAIRNTMNAAYCAIWLVDSESGSLQCLESSFESNKPEIKRFADESRHLVFEQDFGLPGRVRQSRETHWIEDLATAPDFPRQDLAVEAGLVSGVALPIVIGSMVYGVVEIFTVARLERNDALHDMLQSVGNEIGQFIVRKRLDEKLRDEEARISAILSVALDAIITIDMNGRVVDFNPAAERTFGFTKEEVQGRFLSETIIPPEYRDAHTAGLARYLTTGIATVLGRRLELTAMRKDASVFPVELAISATTARNGTPFFTAHLRDITEHKQFVRKIVERDNHITALLNSTAEGIYGINPDGCCTFANASAARLLGVESSDDLIGRQMHELIHHTLPNGQPYPAEDCRIFQAFRLGESVHAEDEVYWRADGSSFAVEYWSYPQIHDGRIVGCVVSFLDITDRKMAEAERKRLLSDLADRESHLRRVIDNTLGFIGVLDSQGVLREANETALVAGGVDRTEVIGRPFWECYWWSHDAQVVKDLKAAIATALQGEVVRYDVEVRMAGDSRLTIDFMLAPVKDADGQVTHLIPSGVDVSERKWVEREVQQRVAQLDLALESGRMGIWEWDIPADHVTWSNQLYEMFGYTTENFESTKSGFLEVVFPEDRPQLESMIKSAFAGACVRHEVEFRVVRGDNGEIVWTHCRGTVRRDDEGSPLLILSVAVDITERKQRELSLAFLSDLQSRLTGFSSEDVIIAETSRLVAEYLQLSHLLLIEMDDEATQAQVVSDHCRDETSNWLGMYEMADFATETERRQLVSGFPMVVCDTRAPDRPAVLVENFEKLNVGAILSAPCKRDKKLTFMLSGLKSAAYDWKDHEVQLMRELATILRLKLERARAEVALRESEARFRDLADNISQFAWMADPGGSVFWYNHQWFDYTGTTLEEMRDWGWNSVQHPDHIDRVECRWQECLKTGEVWEDTFPLRSKDGEYRWFLSRAQPIRDENGKIQRWFGTNTDITKAKHADDALRAKEEQMRLGIEVAKFAIAQIDYLTDTIHLSREAAILYGIGDQEMDVTRQHMHDRVHPDDHEEMRECLEQLLTASGEDEIAMEHRVVLPDGATRWLDIRQRVVFDRSVQPPRPVRGVLAARDISDQKNWELELADREAHLRRVINNQLGLVGVIDRRGILVEIDDRSMNIAGLAREDVIGRHFADCAWWTYDEAVSRNMRESMAKAFAGETVRYDVALYAKNDGRLMIDFMIAPVRDDQGQIVFLIPSGVDISERKRTEEQLAASRERLTMAMTSARMGLYEWEPESDRVLWDEQHLAITGLPHTEMTGTDFLALVHPDDVEANRTAIEQTMRGESDYDTEFRIIRHDGQIRWLAARGKLVPATTDRPLRIVGMNWDITEQKLVHEVIRLGEARLQRIIAGTSVGIAFASVSGSVTRANDAALKMLGISHEQFQESGFNWGSVIRPSDAVKARSLILQLKESGVMPPFELQLLRADKSCVPVMVSAMSVDPNSDEHVVFLVDLTEQKLYEQSLHEARKQAEAANESKSEFVANMSHEIRTPMTAVLGYADLLSVDEDDPQKLQYLQTIKRNGNFLLDIINDILDLSKIEAGKMEILKERFPVQSVIADVRSMMDARAIEKSLEFLVEYTNKIPAEIESDPKRLRQILVNLIGNAIKFTESGSVKLEVGYVKGDGDSGMIQFDVTDTGIGITPEQKQRLFQPFSQGDASVTRSFGGTGLGLAISRRLARFLGGDIVLNSQVSQGSKFSFAVTVGDITGVRHIRPSASIEREGQTKVLDCKLECHVLIVDDRRDVRFLSRRLLTKAGATVTEAEDGQEAIEFVKGMTESKTEFDLVLLDMQMPRMDGYQTAKTLRRLGFTKPIVALTADAMHGDMNRCLESGCDDYVSKPIDSNILLEMVVKYTKPPAYGA